MTTGADVGRFLGRLRGSTGLTLKAVAHRMGVHESNLGRIERGERDIQVSTLLRYLKAIGFHISFKRDTGEAS
jgi:transcriptional regulator with XRE-family HTH domain